MKKIFIAICILFIISIIAGVVYSNFIANYKPTIKDVVLKTNSTDVKEISYQIMKEYFDEYKKLTVAKEYRLSDYTINSINDIKGNTDDEKRSTDKYSFVVDYSVKPSDINSIDWIAGDGEAKGDWIVNKSAFVYIEKVNNGYKITGMGTGP